MRIMKQAFGIQVSRFALAALALGLVIAASPVMAGEVNIYSARQESLIKPQLDAFTAKTGIKVNLVAGKAEELVQRLKTEGKNSQADLFFTTDAGNLASAKEMGLFQPISSPVLAAAIPAKYRDPEGYWIGLGVRARPIFYNPDKVDPKELSTYEALTDAKWKGRILVRSSGHIYNQSLVAAMIAHDGAAKAEEWAKGLAANFARKPQGGDRDQIKAAAAGEGDIAIANTYYYAQMLTSPDAAERAAAAKIKVFWPNQKDRGAHVNISGAGVTAASKNKAEAVQLLEFLVSDDAQKIYAEVGQEYPVKQGVALSDEVKALGAFKADDLNLAALGKYNAEAVRIFDRVGWR